MAGLMGRKREHWPEFQIRPHMSSREVLMVYMDVFINDRTKTFHRKNPYFNTLHLISIIMGGSMPKFQGT